MISESLKNEISNYINKFNLKIWFRCDDVGINHPNFTRLNHLLKENNVKSYYAVIPELLDEKVIEQINKNKNVLIMQHGIRHQKNSPLQIEIIDDESVINSCIQGHYKLNDIFKNKYTHILCPPWNKLDKGAEVKLSKHYKGLSCYKNYKSEFSKDINVNLDIINWKAEEYMGHGEVFCKMQSLCEGYIGFCLHHFQMNEEAFEFVEYIVKNFNDKICFVTWLI